MTDPWPNSLFMIGCGNMAGRMLERWLACGLDSARVTVLRPSGKPVAPGVAVVTGYPASLPDGTTILLGMKPQQLATIAPLVAAIEGKALVHISILAGTTVERLRGLFPDSAGIVRVMPNLPVALGEGVCALHADAMTSNETRAAAQAFMEPLGLAEWIADEAQFDLVTALSGSGPAFVYRFIDALAVGAARLGLPEDQAQRLALATVRGAASLAAASDTPPGALADAVASPGGMTREGMNVMDADEAIVTLMTQVLRATRDKGAALARG